MASTGGGDAEMRRIVIHNHVARDAPFGDPEWRERNLVGKENREWEWGNHWERVKRGEIPPQTQAGADKLAWLQRNGYLGSHDRAYFRSMDAAQILAFKPRPSSGPVVQMRNMTQAKPFNAIRSNVVPLPQIGKTPSFREHQHPRTYGGEWFPRPPGRFQLAAQAKEKRKAEGMAARSIMKVAATIPYSSSTPPAFATQQSPSSMASFGRIMPYAAAQRADAKKKVEIAMFPRKVQELLAFAAIYKRDWPVAYNEVRVHADTATRSNQQASATNDPHMRDAYQAEAERAYQRADARFAQLKNAVGVKQPPPTWGQAVFGSRGQNY